MSPKEILYVNNILYRGNKKTKERIISREVDIQPKAQYLRSELEALIELDENKIFNTSLFNKVEGVIIPYQEDSSKVNVVFFVEERWYIWPTVLFKLADRNFSDWLINQKGATDRFEYGFKFDQYNVRGLNEKLSVLAQFGFKKQFGFGYKIPYLNKNQTFGIATSFIYREFDQIHYFNDNGQRLFIKADELFPNEDANKIISTEISTRVEFNYRESFYNTHTFGLHYNQTYVDDTIRSASLNPDYMLGDDNVQRSFDLIYQFRRDFRDRNNYPLDGFVINAFLRKTGLGIFQDVDQGSAEINTAIYTPLYKDRLYLGNSLSGYTSYPRKQGYINYNGLGFGNNLLKGYELYVIQGQHYMMNKNELKFRLFSVEGNLGKLMFLKQFRKIPLSAYFKVFFDQGIVGNSLENPSISQFTNNYLYSTGVGLDLVTYYDAVLRLEYSINRLGDTAFFINVKSGI